MISLASSTQAGQMWTSKVGPATPPGLSSRQNEQVGAAVRGPPPPCPPSPGRRWPGACRRRSARRSGAGGSTRYSRGCPRRSGRTPPRPAFAWRRSGAAAQGSRSRILGPPTGSRFSWSATLSRARATAASSRDPWLVRETRRRSPVPGSRETSRSTRQTPSRTGMIPSGPRFRRRWPWETTFFSTSRLVDRRFDWPSVVDRLRRARPSGTVVSRADMASDLGFLGADDGIRTRDPNLGKVVLYQLSHVRVRPCRLSARCRRPDHDPVWPKPPSPLSVSGSSSTTEKVTPATARITSWAIRSPRRTEKASVGSVLTSRTLISPR